MAQTKFFIALILLFFLIGAVAAIIRGVHFWVLRWKLQKIIDSYQTTENVVLSISKGKISPPILISKLLEQVRNCNDFGSLLSFQFSILDTKLRISRFFASILVLLGLLGTVSGLITSLGGINYATNSNFTPATLSSSVSSVLSGLDTAFHTTFAGISSTVFLYLILFISAAQFHKLWEAYVPLANGTYSIDNRKRSLESKYNEKISIEINELRLSLENISSQLKSAVSLTNQHIHDAVITSRDLNLYFGDTLDRIQALQRPIIEGESEFVKRLSKFGEEANIQRFNVEKALSTLENIQETLIGLSHSTISHTDMLRDTLIRLGVAFPTNIIMPVTVFLNKGSYRNAKKTIKKIRLAFDKLEFDVIAEDPLEKGSWFTRLIIRSRKAVTNEDVTERLKKLERGVELLTIGKAQSDVDEKTAIAAKALIEAVKDQDEATIHIGSLLLVKDKNPNGGSRLAVRQLTQKEMQFLEKNLNLLRKPNLVFQELEFANDIEASKN